MAFARFGASLNTVAKSNSIVARSLAILPALMTFMAELNLTAIAVDERWSAARQNSLERLHLGDFGKLLCSGNLGGFASSRKLKKFVY